MISLTQLSHKSSPSNWKKWIWIGFAAVPAIHFYYVQEMIAALIIFSVLFLVVATVVLIIFLLDRASQQVTAWAEAGVAGMVHCVVDAVESMIARPVRVQAERKRTS